MLYTLYLLQQVYVHMVGSSMLNLYHMTAKIPYYENEIHMIENLVASLKETYYTSRTNL